MNIRTTIHSPRLRHLGHFGVVAIVFFAAAELLLGWWPSPLPQVETSIEIPDGAHLRLVLASSAEERAHGLSERTDLPHDGLLLLWPAPGQHPIWMYKMRFPLDLVWCDSAGRVLWLNANTRACDSEQDCPLYGLPTTNARAVLELRAGSIRALGLQLGQRIQIAALAP